MNGAKHLTAIFIITFSCSSYLIIIKMIKCPLPDQLTLLFLGRRLQPETLFIGIQMQCDPHISISSKTF